MLQKKMPLLTAITFAVFSGFTQSPVNDFNVVLDTLDSKILGEKRPIAIILPDKYSKTKDSFDVFYATDGEWTTKIAASFAEFLSIQFIPQNIIVTVPNSKTGEQGHRERDFLPTRVPYFNESGGADKFLSFFSDELIPYINAKYRTTRTNNMYGSSFGGVFSMYTFLKKPELFKSYMLADPAFQYDDRVMVRMADSLLPELSVNNTNFLMTGRAGKAFKEMGIAAMDSLFRKKTPAGLRYKLNVYDDETHNSMIFRTIYDGLKFAYSGYSNDPLVIYPSNGTIVPGQPLKVFYQAEMMKNLHYTVDGSLPTEQSPKVDSDFIVVNGPSELVLRSISNNEKYDQMAKGSYKAGTALKGIKLSKKAKPGGLNYYFYQGQWDSLPDFRKIKAKQTGVADSAFGMSKLPADKNFALVQDGFIEIKDDGYCYLGLNCNGAARLIFAGFTLMDIPANQDENAINATVVPLTKGIYPVRIEYHNTVGSPYCHLFYLPPGKEDVQTIPVEFQYAIRKGS